MLEGEWRDPETCEDSLDYAGVISYRGNGKLAKSLDAKIYGRKDCMDENNITEYSVNGSFTNWDILDGMMRGEKLDFEMTIYHDEATNAIQMEIWFEAVDVNFDTPKLLPQGIFHLNLHGTMEAKLSSVNKPSLGFVSARGTVRMSTTFGPRDNPFLSLHGDMTFAVPCHRGDYMGVSGSIDVNMGPVKIESMGTDARTYCEPLYGDKILFLRAHLDFLKLGALRVEDVEMVVEIYQFTEYLRNNTMAAFNGTMPSATAVPIPPDGADMAFIGFIKGKVGNNEMYAMFDTSTRDWEVTATIVIDTEFLQANITGSFATRCRATGDTVKGSVSVFAHGLFVAEDGEITGTRFCDPASDVRYNIFVAIAEVSILDAITATDVTLSALGKPPLRDDGEVVEGVKDDSLDWDVELSFVLDMALVAGD